MRSIILLFFRHKNGQFAEKYKKQTIRCDCPKFGHSGRIAQKYMLNAGKGTGRYFPYLQRRSKSAIMFSFRSERLVINEGSSVGMPSFSQSITRPKNCHL